MVFVLTLMFAFGALIYWKYDLLFKRNLEKRLPVGWLVITIFLVIFQLIIFNTFPQMIKVDPHAEHLLRVVSHDMFSDSTMYEVAE
jgi:predicted ABC-type exoprotein transport system permease subunit